MKNLFKFTRLIAVVVMAVVTAWGGAFYVQAAQGTPPDRGGSAAYADERPDRGSSETEADRYYIQERYLPGSGHMFYSWSIFSLSGNTEYPKWCTRLRSTYRRCRRNVWRTAHFCKRHRPSCIPSLYKLQSRCSPESLASIPVNSVTLIARKEVAA